MTASTSPPPPPMTAAGAALPSSMSTECVAPSVMKSTPRLTPTVSLLVPQRCHRLDAVISGELQRSTESARSRRHARQKIADSVGPEDLEGPPRPPARLGEKTIVVGVHTSILATYLLAFSPLALSPSPTPITRCRITPLWPSAQAEGRGCGAHTCATLRAAHPRHPSTTPSIHHAPSFCSRNRPRDRWRPTQTVRMEAAAQEKTGCHALSSAVHGGRISTDA